MPLSRFMSPHVHSRYSLRPLPPDHTIPGRNPRPRTARVRGEAMNRDQALREHLLYLLRGGGAHLDFEAAIADLPAELRGAAVAGVPHTPWRLLEHLRIAQ